MKKKNTLLKTSQFYMHTRALHKFSQYFICIFFLSNVVILQIQARSRHFIERGLSKMAHQENVPK